MSAPAPAVQRRVLGVLTATQVLGTGGVAAGVAVSALAAAALSGSAAVGGLAATAPTLGSALLAVPAASLADRRGRRPALVLGYGIGALGAGLAVLALAVRSWPLLLGALILFGGGSMAGLAARYAATDLAAPHRRARALSVVVWASTAGVVVGPNLAGPAGQAAGGLGLPEAAGAYLVTMLVFLAAALVAGLGLRPDPLVLARETAGDAGCPMHGGVLTVPSRQRRAAAWRQLRGQTRLALAGIVLCHAAMVGLMSMTPVHLDHGGHSLAVVGVVISLHAAAMYAASPLFGWLADRHGRVPVLGLGAALVVAAAGIAGTSDSGDAPQLALALILLGFGWSAGVVSGSALLTESVPLAERPNVQGLSDLLMNLGGAGGGVLAGVLVTAGSYAALGLLVGFAALPLLVICALRALQPA
ncbi:MULTISPECIES: MFS transporter [unclassified Crossiella]|uniref:MFS transporter n=1 Tax=unclassified Crossiella TaxID=2620835 RepID=UPI001FFF3AD4|nr:MULTISPECIES: MFS transporter [unclassified Crossiella]MCK2240202.1 MFS transporter [Crossiella sp. S99.2]MCK2253346.1 MFS transporter [Crossiella sp. S99.1]